MLPLAGVISSSGGNANNAIDSVFNARRNEIVLCVAVTRSVADVGLSLPYYAKL
jgi:hypothetical protein